MISKQSSVSVNEQERLSQYRRRWTIGAGLILNIGATGLVHAAIVLPSGAATPGTVLGTFPVTASYSTSLPNIPSSDHYGVASGGICLQASTSTAMATIWCGKGDSAGNPVFVAVGDGGGGVVAAGLPAGTALRFTGSIILNTSGRVIDQAGKGLSGVYTSNYVHSIGPTSVSPGLCINTTRGSLVYGLGFASAEFAYTSSESGGVCNPSTISNQSTVVPDGIKYGLGSVLYSVQANLVAEIVATSAWTGQPGSTTVNLGSITYGLRAASTNVAILRTATGSVSVATTSGTCSAAGLTQAGTPLSFPQYILPGATRWTSRGMDNPPVSSVGQVGTTATSPDGSSAGTYTDMGILKSGAPIYWGWNCSGTNDSGGQRIVGVSIRSTSAPYQGVAGASTVNNDQAHYFTLNLKSSAGASATPDCSHSSVALDGSWFKALHTFSAGSGMNPGYDASLPTPVLTLCNTGIAETSSGMKTLGVTISSVMQ